MLINLSNHPSSKWSSEQLDAAEKSYQLIEDIPFPHVPPEAETFEVEAMAFELFENIKLHLGSPRWLDAIHIAGEMTFTMAFVALAQRQGFNCISSTTKRIVEDKPDGSKISVFKFCRFRTYPNLNPNNERN
ncbi:MAG: CRISPR-associated protein [Saprospiraceae bacterium]|nr:CRISPR-associated protein [Saprospiraceae bacterium]